MRITFGVLIVSASLMLASFAHADMSSLDPEHFLDPYDQDTVALIESDLAALAHAERAEVLLQEPDLSAPIEVAPAVEPLSEAAVAGATLKVREQAGAAAPEAAVDNQQVDATGFVPLTAVTEAQPTAPGDESTELTLIKAPSVEQTSAPEGEGSAAMLQ
jgi:hypothetical protein